MITNHCLIGYIIIGFPGDRTKELEVNPVKKKKWKAKQKTSVIVTETTASLGKEGSCIFFPLNIKRKPTLNMDRNLIFKTTVTLGNR